ncbi:MAG TPA: LptF/LptG family permease, partial [Gemmatimonadaceae bacterium]|nr:LptF/LptG family permease [Gemmatimonadaceae bacterium]
MVRALDRYVFTEFWKIFVTTALGFPILVNIIDLTDNLDKYLGQKLTPARIALSYLYWLPDSMFMVLPAAVLFATVFAIGALTRHSEITAAKASGISFYRFIAPIFAGAIIATVVGLILGELAPITNKKRLEILQGTQTNLGNDR